MKMKIEDIKFVKELYPRAEIDNTTLNQYREAIEQLPPILISKRENILIDGYHRLVAHKLEKFEEIDVEISEAESDTEILLESLRRNAKHGKQLSLKEKKSNAIALYNNGVDEKTLIELLSVSDRSMDRWLKDLKDEERNERDELIWDMWLNCRTLEEIAEEMQQSKGNISKIIEKLQNGQVAKSEQEPENLQYYNTWSQFSMKDSQMKYPGQTPEDVLENIIYYYSDPLDVVVDPMAGSGITGAVCKRVDRKYLLYDIRPIREDINIEKGSILEGLPNRAKNVGLVFLDPPYYNLMDKDYPDNEFTGDYDSFLTAMRTALKNCAKKLKDGGYLALFLKPMNEKMLDGEWLDMSFDCCNIAQSLKLKYVKRISCPLSTQQFNANAVSRAKKEKKMLNTLRDVLIFQK